MKKQDYLLLKEKARAEDKQKDVLSKQYALSNDFIRLPNKFSIGALQILGLILSNIDFTKNYGDVDIVVNLKVKDIKKVCDSNSNNDDFYKKAIIELGNKTHIVIDNDKEFTSAFLFPDVEIKKNTGDVRVVINKRFNKEIQNLYHNFTAFKLLNTYKFSSRYAYILYMNLCSWQNHSKDRKDLIDERARYYTTKQLKEMFDLGVDAYCTTNGKFNRGQFELRVINTAVIEINKYSNIRVFWHKEYKNKQVERYVFEYYRTDAVSTDNDGYFSY